MDNDCVLKECNKNVVVLRVLYVDDVLLIRSNKKNIIKQIEKLLSKLIDIDNYEKTVHILK